MKTKILFFILVVFLIGCKTQTVYVPVEKTRTEYLSKTLLDTIFQRDSIFVKMRGDTTFIYKEKNIYHTKTWIDTIFRTDTIPKINTIEIVKEKEVVPKWCWYLIIAVLLYIIYKVVRKKYFK